MKIVVDSGCDLTEEIKKDNDMRIETVPLTLLVNNKSYVDDEKMDIVAYISEMESSKETPKTAAPSPDSYLEKYKGDESVFVVTLSSYLSASYNNAVLAKDMYLEEMGNKFIHIFNSLTASVGETIISLKINEFIKDKLSNSEIVEKVNTFIEGMHTYFILENYDNLAKNGRMNPYIAKIGKMLSIKPICYADKGKIDMIDKGRGYNKSVEKLINLIEKSSVNFEEKILAISHVCSIEKALEFKEKISKRLKFKDIIIVQASGLCSTYAEKEGIIISF